MNSYNVIGYIMNMINFEESDWVLDFYVSGGLTRK